MGISEPKMPTPEWLAEVQKQRELENQKAIEGGARLEFTAEQVEEARKEMKNEIGDNSSEKTKMSEMLAIEEASNFDELYKTLDNLGGLQGTQEFFDSEKLKHIIDNVRKGKYGINYITRTEGLRGKVFELLNLERDNLIQSIPENDTEGVLYLTKISQEDTYLGSIKKGNGVAGKLMNPPIEVGKHVELAMGHTSEVLSISKEEDKYFIRTNGGEYILQKM